MIGRQGYRRSGLSLVEVLITLAITAVLMGAIAQAVKASLDAFRTNQSQAMLTMRARVVLMRIIDQIRANGDVVPLNVTAAYTALGTPIARQADGTGGDTGIIVFEPQPDGVTEIHYTYQWDAASKQLNMKRDVVDVTNPAAPRLVSTSTQSLLHGVVDFNVSMRSGIDTRALPARTTYDRMTRAAIVMTVVDTGPQMGASGSPAAITVSGSAVPRQNAWTGDQLKYSIDTMLAQEARYQ